MLSLRELKENQRLLSSLVRCFEQGLKLRGKAWVFIEKACGCIVAFPVLALGSSYRQGPVTAVSIETDPRFKDKIKIPVCQLYEQCGGPVAVLFLSDAPKQEQQRIKGWLDWQGEIQSAGVLDLAALD